MIVSQFLLMAAFTKKQNCCSRPERKIGRRQKRHDSDSPGEPKGYLQDSLLKWEKEQTLKMKMSISIQSALLSERTHQVPFSIVSFVLYPSLLQSKPSASLAWTTVMCPNGASYLQAPPFQTCLQLFPLSLCSIKNMKVTVSLSSSKEFHSPQPFNCRGTRTSLLSLEQSGLNSCERKFIPILLFSFFLLNAQSIFQALQNKFQFQTHFGLSYLISFLPALLSS